MSDTIKTSTRKFVRDFTRMKHLAASGTSVRIVEDGLEFVFALDHRQDGFLGCTQGTLKHQAAPKKLFFTGDIWDSQK